MYMSGYCIDAGIENSNPLMIGLNLLNSGSSSTNQKYTVLRYTMFTVFQMQIHWKVSMHFVAGSVFTQSLYIKPNNTPTAWFCSSIGINSKHIIVSNMTSITENTPLQLTGDKYWQALCLCMGEKQDTPWTTWSYCMVYMFWTVGRNRISCQL